MRRHRICCQPARHLATGLGARRALVARTLQKGAEMGRFQLGSTVILLLPPGVANWDAALAAGSPLRMGQRIGSLSN